MVPDEFAARFLYGYMGRIFAKAELHARGAHTGRRVAGS